MVLYFTAILDSKLTYISWKFSALISYKLYSTFYSVKKYESDASA